MFHRCVEHNAESLFKEIICISNFSAPFSVSGSQSLTSPGFKTETGQDHIPAQLESGHDRFWALVRLLVGPNKSLRSDLNLAACYTNSILLPWILSIWPSLRAAPRTLHSVLTIRSALASERKGLWSRTAFLSPMWNYNSVNIFHRTICSRKLKPTNYWNRVFMISVRTLELFLDVVMMSKVIIIQHLHR